MRRKAAALLSDWGWTKAALTVVFTDDVEVRALNRRWRKLDRTTDVLSFPMDGGPPVLGDIVISVESALRQAAGRTTLEDELVFLLVHGFLHLCGYDHDSVAKRRSMRALERRLRERLKLSRPLSNRGLKNR